MPGIIKTDESAVRKAVSWDKDFPPKYETRATSSRGLVGKASSKSWNTDVQISPKTSRTLVSTRSIRSLSLKRLLLCEWCRKTQFVEPESGSETEDESRISYLNKQRNRYVEEELLWRLQQAANELGESQQNARDIEAEILKWQRKLEIEHKIYENHNRPKFQYKFFRQNQYLVKKKHPLYATNYEDQRQLEKRRRRRKRTMRRIIKRMRKKLKNKVSPEPFLFKRMGAKSRRIIPEQRFVARVNAPSQQSYRSEIRSEVYTRVQAKMKRVYDAQVTVQKEFQKLLNFKHVQDHWLRLTLGILSTGKIHSVGALAFRILLRQHRINNHIDIRFLKKTLEQLVNLLFFSSTSELHDMPRRALLPHLADQLIKLTAFRTDDFSTYITQESEETSSSSETSEDSNNNNKNRSSSSSISSVGSSDDDRSFTGRTYILDKIRGKELRSPDELRVLSTIRIKRAMGMPYRTELDVLTFLRRERARKQREVSCWTSSAPLPIDQFVPSSISNKQKEKICLTLFHAVVVEGNDHYVLKKLPIPRPRIVRVTRKFILSQPGSTFSDKVAYIVKSKMQRNIQTILAKRDLKTWSKRKLKRHLWKVADRVDDDVYDFLDRIMTLIVVILDDSPVNPADTKSTFQRMYLLPRTRRKIPTDQVSKLMEAQRKAHASYDIATYNSILRQRSQQNELIKLLDQPADIVYHNSDNDSDDSDKRKGEGSAKSSSGSTSSLSDTALRASTSRPAPVKPTINLAELTDEDFANFMTTGLAESRYLLTKETLQRRDKRSLLRIRGRDPDIGIVEHEDEYFDPNIRLAMKKVSHVSARRWTRLHRSDTDLNYTGTEATLHQTVDQEAERLRSGAPFSRLSTFSKKAKSLDLLSYHDPQETLTSKDQPSASVASVQYLRDVGSTAAFEIKDVELDMGQTDDTPTVREMQLCNTNPRLIYIPIGKTLLVETVAGNALHYTSSTSDSTNPPQVLYHNKSVYK